MGVIYYIDYRERRCPETSTCSPLSAREERTGPSQGTDGEVTTTERVTAIWPSLLAAEFD